MSETRFFLERSQWHQWEGLLASLIVLYAKLAAPWLFSWAVRADFSEPAEFLVLD